MHLSGLTALYSPSDIEISQIMSGPYEDLSYHGDDCTVIAGIKDGRISGFWRPMVAAGADKSLKLQVERLYDISQNIYYMDFLEGGQLSIISQFLLRHGYKARPVYTQVIALTQTVEELRAGLRKSYRSLVNECSRVVLTRHGSAYNILNIRHKVGRADRHMETWFLQNRMVTDNQAYVLLYSDYDPATDTDLPEAAVMAYHNGQWAYYASGVSENGVNTHRLICAMILHAKHDLGCQSFELGEQVFALGQQMMDGKYASSKNVEISFFKRGFGGKTLTRLILEKA